MIYTVFFLAWLLYTIIEGYREAYYWHHKMYTTDYGDETNLHTAFTIQRGIVSVMLFYSLTLVLNIYGSLLLLVANTLIFSFIHNGSMYYTRYVLSKRMFPNDKTKWLYTKGWFSQSSTSTAVLTKFMTPLSRTIQFVLGVGVYIFVFIKYILW